MPGANAGGRLSRCSFHFLLWAARTLGLARIGLYRLHFSLPVYLRAGHITVTSVTSGRRRARAGQGCPHNLVLPLGDHLTFTPGMPFTGRWGRLEAGLWR